MTPPSHWLWGKVRLSVIGYWNNCSGNRIGRIYFNSTVSFSCKTGPKYGLCDGLKGRGGTICFSYKEIPMLDWLWVTVVVGILRKIASVLYIYLVCIGLMFKCWNGKLLKWEFPEYLRAGPAVLPEMLILAWLLPGSHSNISKKLKICTSICKGRLTWRFVHKRSIAWDSSLDKSVRTFSKKYWNNFTPECQESVLFELALPCFTNVYFLLWTKVIHLCVS